MYYMIFAASFLALFSPSLLTDSVSPKELPVNPFPAAKSTQTQNILFLSEDLGHSWTDLSAGLPGDIGPNCFWPGSEGYLLGAIKGLYKGSPMKPRVYWELDRLDQREVTGIYPGQLGPYVLSRWKGLYQWQPATGMWKPITQELSNKSIQVMLETKDRTLLVGCEGGLYRSVDSGKSWQQVVHSGTIFKIVETNNTLVALTNYEIIRSTDGGLHWNRSLKKEGYIFALQANGQDLVAIVQGTEFAGVRSPNEVYRSADLGVSWKPMFSSLPSTLKGIYDLRQVGKIMLAGAEGGIFRSMDTGITWEHVLKLPGKRGGFFNLVESDDLVYALYVEGC